MRRIDELVKLMQEHPDLPIVPMVDGEIPGDTYGNWLGAWGASKVDEYVLPPLNAWFEGVLFRSDDDVFGALEKCLPNEEWENLPESEAECRPYYDALPWVKAIIVYITLPE